jgi:hypothetical protein
MIGRIEKGRFAPIIHFFERRTPGEVADILEKIRPSMRKAKGTAGNRKERKER